MIQRYNRTVSRTTKPKSKTVRWILFLIVAVIICLGVWTGSVVFNSLNKVTAGSGKNSLLQLFSLNSKLQGEDEGRTNILLLGKGGDNHPGGNLTDTMEVMSIDWKNNKIAFISVPRDLWVQIPGFTTYSKINAANYYGDQNYKTTGGGGKEASLIIGQILGIPIHYSVTIDFQGFKEIIDKVGGVDIYVDKAISDPFYPAADMIRYDTFYITVGQHHLDGETALKYARSRETTSDFDRARRQQQIIAAAKQKLISAQTLANPIKITDLLNIVGNHFRTNLTIGEIKTLWDKTQNIDTANAINYVFDTSPTSPLIGLSSDERGYIIIPKRGIGNYTDMQYIGKNIFNLTPAELAQSYSVSPQAQAEMKPKTATSPSVSTGLPKIEIANATSETNAAANLSKTLKAEGYNVAGTSNINDVYRQTTVYSCANSTNTSLGQTVKNLTSELKAVSKSKTNCTGFDIQVVIGQSGV